MYTPPFSTQQNKMRVKKPVAAHIKAHTAAERLKEPEYSVDKRWKKRRLLTLTKTENPRA